jgi:chromosome segregation ATPase
LEIRAGLDSLGLPGALAKFRKLLEGGGLDALSEPSREAEGWAREIQEKERGRDSAGAMLKTLGEAKSRVENDLKAIQEQLDGETRECESARVRLSCSCSSLNAHILTVDTFLPWS